MTYCLATTADMSAPEAAQVQVVAFDDRLCATSYQEDLPAQQVHDAAAQDTAATEASQASPADTPLPLPYVVENEAKRPLPGVQSVFLTGDGVTSRVGCNVQCLMFCSFQALHSGWLGQQKPWLDRLVLQCL